MQWFNSSTTPAMLCPVVMYRLEERTSIHNGGHRHLTGFGMLQGWNGRSIYGLLERRTMQIYYSWELQFGIFSHSILTKQCQNRSMANTNSLDQQILYVQDLYQRQKLIPLGMCMAMIFGLVCFVLYSEYVSFGIRDILLFRIYSGFVSVCSFVFILGS